MATRVGLEKIWVTPFDWLTPKPPVWWKKSGTYVKFDQIYSKFCAKICRFSSPWQQGLVWHKLHFHSWSGWPVKPPIWHKSLYDISYTSELLPIFCWNLPFSVTMVTKVGLEKFWMTLRLADPQYIVKVVDP